MMIDRFMIFISSSVSFVEVKVLVALEHSPASYNHVPQTRTSLFQQHASKLVGVGYMNP